MQNFSIVNGFWQPHFCPPLPFIRSGQEWEAVSDASGGGSSCSSSSSGTPMKRKYLASELKSLTTTELTPTLLKYVAATLGASPQSATSFRDSSEPPSKRPKPSTPTRPLAAPNSAAPTDRRHSQMFDTLLVVAAKVFQDSISGREDVELLDFSLQRNPPPSPLLSSRPTPLATPPTTGADNQPPLSSPHTKEMEEKRQELLEQLQEADEEQKLQEKKEKKQLEQLQKQQQQEELLQEKRKEKQPTVPKRKRQLVLPSIDQEALPMKPNTFEFLFFHTNRYVLEKNWMERKVTITKSLRAGRGKKAYRPPTAEAKQAHKMFLADKTDLKLILKGAKLDLYEMEKQWGLDHAGPQATQPGPSTAVPVLPKRFRPARSPPTTAEQGRQVLEEEVFIIEDEPIVLEEEDTVIGQEEEVMAEEYKEEYENTEEAEVSVLTDSEDDAPSSSGSSIMDDDDFINVVGTPPPNVTKVKLIFDEDLETSDEESDVDVLNDTGEEKEKCPEAERIAEPSPLINVDSTPEPVEDLPHNQYTKPVETRREETCPFESLPRIPLQQPFDDLFVGREILSSGDDFYDSSEDFDRENKVIFPEEDLGRPMLPLRGDGSLPSTALWDDQIELLSPEENSEVLPVA